MPIITMMDNLQNSVNSKINEDIPSSANNRQNFNPENPFHYNEDENDDIFNDLDDPEPTVSNVLSHIVSKSCESSINSIKVSDVQNINESRYEYIAPNNGSQNNIVPKEYSILKQTENIVKAKSSVKDTSCDFEEDTSMPGPNESSIQNNATNIKSLKVCPEVINSLLVHKQNNTSNYVDTNNTQKYQLEQTKEKYILCTFDDKTQTNDSAIEKFDVEEEYDLNAQNNISELIKKNNDQELVEPLCNKKSLSVEVQCTSEIFNNISDGHETTSPVEKKINNETFILKENDNVSKSLVENKSPINLNIRMVNAIEEELNLIHGEVSNKSNFNEKPIITHSITNTNNSFISDGTDHEDDIIYSQIDYIISQCSSPPTTKSTKNITISKSRPISILEDTTHEKKTFDNTNSDKNASCDPDNKTSIPMSDSNSIQGDKIITDDMNLIDDRLPVQSHKINSDKNNIIDDESHSQNKVNITDDIVTNNDKSPVKSHEIHDDKNNINDDESHPQNKIIITDDIVTYNNKSPVQSHEIRDDTVDLNYGHGSIENSKLNASNVEIKNDMSPVQSDAVFNDNYDQVSTQNNELITDNVEINCNKSPVQSCERNSDISNNDDMENDKCLVQNNDLSPVQSHEVGNDNDDQVSTHNNDLITDNVEINYNNSSVQSCEPNSDISNNDDMENDKCLVSNNDLSSVQSHEVCNDNDDQVSTQNNDLITDNVEINYNKSSVQSCEPNSAISNNDDMENDKCLVQNNDLITDNVEMNHSKSSVQSCEPNSDISINDNMKNNKCLAQNNDLSPVQSHEVCNDNDDQVSTQNNDLITDNVEMNYNKSSVQSCKPNSNISINDDMENNKCLVQNNDLSSVQSHEVCNDNDDQGSTQNNYLITDNVEMNYNKSPVQSCEPNSDISNNYDIENKYLVRSLEVYIHNDGQSSSKNNDLISDSVEMNCNKSPVQSCKPNSDICNNDNIENYKYVIEGNDISPVQSHEICNDSDDQGSSQNNEFISDNFEINYNKSHKLNRDISNVNDDNSIVQSNNIMASITSCNTSESSYLILKEKQIKSISLNISSLITEHIKNVVLQCSKHNKHKPFNVDSSKQLDLSVTLDSSTIVESILDNLNNKKTGLTKKIIKVIDTSLDSIYYNEKKNVDNIITCTKSENTLNFSTNDTKHNGSSEKKNQEETCAFPSFLPKDDFIQLMKDFNEDVKNVSVSKISVTNLKNETDLCSTGPQLKCLPITDSNIESNTLNIKKENSKQCSMKLSCLSKNTLNTSNDIEQINLLPRNMNKSPKTSTRSSSRCNKNSSEPTKRIYSKRLLRHNPINTSSDFSEYESEDPSTNILPKTNEDKIKKKCPKQSQSIRFSAIKNQEENKKIFVTENSKLKKHITGRKRAAETPVSPPKAKISKRNSLSKIENSTVCVSDSPKVYIGPDVMLTLKSSKPSLMPVSENSILEKNNKKGETQKSKENTQSKKRKLSYSSDDPSSFVEVTTRRSIVKKTVNEECPESIPTTSRIKNQNVDQFSLSSEASSPEVNVMTNKIRTRRSCNPSLMQVSDNSVLEKKKKKAETQKYNEKTQSKKQKLSCSSDGSALSVELKTRQSSLKKAEDKEGPKSSIPTTSRTKNQKVDEFNLNNDAKFNNSNILSKSHVV